MIVDANLLLYAVDNDSPHHDRAAEWLTGVLDGDRRVGLAWQTVGAFVRIATHPRVFTTPIRAADAVRVVRRWLAVPVVWVPPATARTSEILLRLVDEHALTADLVPDAQLAALALEHGLEVQTADTDFARFPDVRWANPLRHDA